MYNIPMLTASTVRTICPEINVNIATTLIDSATVLVQSTLIKDTLTQDFMDDLYGAFTGNSMSAAYTTLKANYLDYILAYGVYKHLIISQSYQLNEAGLRLKTSDHSSAAEPQDLAFMRDYIDNFIDSTRKTMIRYIEDHQGDFPLYFTDKYGDVPMKNNFKIAKAEVRNCSSRGMDYPR